MESPRATQNLSAELELDPRSKQVAVAFVVEVPAAPMFSLINSSTEEHGLSDEIVLKDFPGIQKIQVVGLNCEILKTFHLDDFIKS